MTISKTALIAFTAIVIPSICFAFIGDWTVWGNAQEGLCITTNNGYVWFGTKGGIVKMNPITEEYELHTTHEGLGGLEIVGLASDDNGYLWFAAKNGYVGAYVGSKWFSVDDLSKNFYQLNRLAFHSGYLWFCTSKGIVKATAVPTSFSIIQFNEYIENFGDFPPQTGVNDIAFLGNTVFVATNEGLAYADIDDNFANPTTWDTTAVWDDAVTSRGIVALEIHHDTLWAMARILESGQPGIFYFDEGELKELNLSSGYTPTDGWELTSLNDTLWALTKWELRYYSPEENRFTVATLDVPRYGCYGITSMSGKTFCATFYGYGILENDTADVDFFNTILGGTISDIVFVGDKVIVSSNNKAVNILENGSWTNYDYYVLEHIVPDWLESTVRGTFGSLRSAIVTDDGTLWLGSYGHGIIRILPDSTVEQWCDTTSSLETSVAGLNYPIANRFRLDPNGNLWVMSYVSEDNVPLKVWTPDNYNEPYGAIGFSTIQGIPNKAVRAISCAWDRVAVATAYGAGIIIHKGTIDSTGDDIYYNLAEQLPNDEVNAVTIGIDGKIWFGTTDGLAYWDPANYIVEVPMPDDLSATIISLAADSSGNIWIGTLDGAAVYLPSGHFATFKSAFSDDAPPSDRTPLIDDAIGTIAASIVGGVHTDGISGAIWFGFNEGAVVLNSPYQQDYEITDLFIYPNPAIAVRGIMPTVCIADAAPDAALIIYDAAGNIIREIPHYMKGHDGVFRWDCKNDNGRFVAPGIFIILASSENGSAKGKLLLIR